MSFPRPNSPRSLRADILLGAAWGESVAGDPARAATLLNEVTSLVPEPDDATVAEMANAELMSLIRLGRFTGCEAVAQRGGAAARRAGRPDLAYGIWIHTACALSGVGNLTGALQAADAAVAATRGMTVIELPCLASRAFVLSRLGRHDEALALAADQLLMAERMEATGHELSRHPQVRFAAATTGTANLLVAVAASHLGGLYAFLTETIGSLGDIRGLEVTPILSSVKRTGLLRPSAV